MIITDAKNDRFCVIFNHITCKGCGKLMLHSVDQLSKMPYKKCDLITQKFLDDHAECKVKPHQIVQVAQVVSDNSEFVFEKPSVEDYKKQDETLKLTVEAVDNGQSIKRMSVIKFDPKQKLIRKFFQ